MEIKKVGNYIFGNEWGKTRNGFYHKSTLYSGDNYYTISMGRVNYLNRTWESYNFQTSMKQAVRNAIDELARKIEYNFRWENNIKRINKEQKIDLARLINTNDEIIEYRELLGVL